MNRPVFVWTPALRLMLWEIMEKCMEIRAATKALHAVDPSTPMHDSEWQTQKSAYLKILECFPDGWMSMPEIERRYLDLKEKISRSGRLERNSTDSQEEERDQRHGLSISSSADVTEQQQEHHSSRKSLSITSSTSAATHSSSGASSTTALPYQPLSPSMSPVTAATQMHPEEDIKQGIDHTADDHTSGDGRKIIDDAEALRRRISM
ncbi:hypothetical protein BGZ99_000398 [Dissophora globulifera]|uniref:Ubinuclein middle domain-containing protein n=1 Tax=Dissophora globulifera TaxID=979702 RepID=A0A9P6R0U8_9FUNG|nr:hypothetical protein BGZ99_000398 [Dissophora globulifera]